MEYLLEARNIKKYFPGVKALDGINFKLKYGEIHGLLGENGAGKSTLINVFAGIHEPDAGEIYISGNLLEKNSISQSKEEGISVIHQELVLVPTMSIMDNIFLGREKRTPYGLDKTFMKEETIRLLRTIGLTLDPEILVETLSIGQQQMIEIAKALSMDVKILIMDEPSSSLTETEVNILFDTMKKLTKIGVGIIYISHKMDELFEITDCITVIRDGKYVDTLKTKDTDSDTLVKLMVGREIENYYTRTEHTFGKEVLKLTNLSRKDILHDINFSVREGEIVGVAGLVGAGRSELFESVLGLHRITEGEIIINDVKIDKINPEIALNLGLVLVPEDRKKQGLFLTHSVKRNITMEILDEIIYSGVLHSNKETKIASNLIKEFNVKTPTQEQKVQNLSGGNQQKIVFAKWLATNPKILILDEPTRGIDVGAKSEIYKIIDTLAGQGMAIVIISSELMELINMCDRIEVMHEGKITGSVQRDDFSQELIMSYATGESKKKVGVS